MNRLKKLVILLFAVFCFPSCEEDVELFSGEQEETVIYGVINIKDTIHFVKVFKTFIKKEEDVSQSLKSSEVLYYEPSEIDVNLLEWQNGNITRTIKMHPKYYDTLGSPADNMFYVANEYLKPNSEYEINVSFKNAERKIVNSKIKPFGERDYFYSFHHEQRTIGIQDYFDSYRAEYIDPLLYKDIAIFLDGNYINRLFYYEIVDGDTSYCHFDWKKVPLEYWRPFPGLEGQFYDYELRFLGDVFPVNPNAKRIVVGLDLVTDIKSAEMQEYDLNTSQPRSEFQYIEYLDNIENGLGFFTSQYSWTYWAKAFTGTTRDSLAHGRYTHHLNFADSEGNYHHF